MMISDNCSKTTTNSYQSQSEGANLMVVVSYLEEVQVAKGDPGVSV